MSGRAERVHRIPAFCTELPLAMISAMWITILFSISPTTTIQTAPSASKIETLSTKPFHVMLSRTISL